MMRRDGFTVTEVLVAVTIVGILAAASVAFYATALQRERWDAARDILRTIYTGEQMYFNLTGARSFYPPTAGDIGTCPSVAVVVRQAGATSCLGVCAAGDTACKDAWRNNTYTDEPNTPGGSVTYRIETIPASVGPPPTPVRFVATAIYNVTPAVTITIDDTGQICPPGGPTSCSWARP